jgi:AcrR family transcriptional regulator
MPRPAKADTDGKQQERILSAALDAFSKAGFEGAKVRDIAAVAGCNHSIIRYYYENKDKLWRAAVQYLFERMDREMQIDAQQRKALQSGCAEAFEVYLRRYVNYCARHPDHARIMVQASVRSDERLAWAADQFIRRQHQSLLPVLRALIKKKVLPDCDPVHLIYIISAGCQMMFTLSPEIEATHGITIDDDQTEAYASAVISLVLCRR